MTLQRGCGRRVWENVSVDELGTLGTGIEALFEVVGCALALKFEGFGLESSVGKQGPGLAAGYTSFWGTSGESIRGRGSIEQNVSVFEILRFRAVLQMLLQTVAAVKGAHGGDGRLVDNNSVLVGHGECLVSGV